MQKICTFKHDRLKIYEYFDNFIFDVISVMNWYKKINPVNNGLKIKPKLNLATYYVL